MLRDILQYTGQSPTTKNSLVVVLTSRNSVGGESAAGMRPGGRNGEGWEEGEGIFPLGCLTRGRE